MLSAHLLFISVMEQERREKSKNTFLVGCFVAIFSFLFEKIHDGISSIQKQHTREMKIMCRQCSQTIEHFTVFHSTPSFIYSPVILNS